MGQRTRENVTRAGVTPGEAVRSLSCSQLCPGEPHGETWSNPLWQGRAPDPESGAPAISSRASATSRQTPGQATTARNCDHNATKPRVTDGDRCPTPVGDVAVDQDQRGREGMGRRGGDG